MDGDTLWLGRRAAGPVAANDSLEVRVYRRIEDGVPLEIETTVRLSVAGSHRIVTVGRALPEGFSPTALTSQLPARIDASGELRLQVEPGDWEVVLRARALTAEPTLRASPAAGHWPTQEVWGFAAARALRVVQIEGAQAIDLSQTDAPFKDLPGYLVSADAELRLVEQFRGDPNPAPNDYRVVREAWLTFDGDHFVVRDALDVTAYRPTRLTADFVPGRVTVNGTPQLITEIEDAVPGIELPQGQYRVEAVSEVVRDGFAAALGWRIDASMLQTTLNLPPGWRLLWTRGVDHAPDAWLAQWNVWNLFLVLIIVAMAARLLGVRIAVLAAVTFLIVYHEPDAPTWPWIVLLILLAGVRVSRAGTFKRWLNIAYFGVWGIALLATVTFAVDGFRKAIYPQLERPHVVTESFSMLPAAAPAALMRRSVDDASWSESIVVTAESRQKRDLYPTGLLVQTGPAVPRWQWTSFPLQWDGPVTADQTLALTLSPPWFTRSLYVIGPVLLLALLLAFGIANAPTLLRLPPLLTRLVNPGTTTAWFLVLTGLLGGALPSPSAAAEIPGPEILGELERRLTAAPECMPGCASLERVRVDLDEGSLSLDVVVHADITSAVPLPGGDRQWLPATVQLDGAPATLRRDDDGQLFIAVPPGRHNVRVSGPVASHDRFELPFPLTPGQLELNVADWEVYGAEEGRLRTKALQFARVVRNTDTSTSSSLRPDPIVPYYTIRRELDFGLEWRATTTIRRIAPAAGVIPFSVPLLPGESILSGQVTTDDGRATGVLAPEDSEQSYESTLTPGPELRLSAPPLDTASESWTLVPSNHWHVEYTGVPPTKVEIGAASGPVFHPLPGETLTVRLSQPTAVPGESVTVEHVQLDEEPGARVRRVTLSLELLSSQGGTFPVSLPADARILAITANGRSEPIPLAAGPVPLPIVPGDQTVTLLWETTQPVGIRTRTSEVGLPTIARNIALHLSLPGDRWPLLVGGPALGPAVMYWGVMVAVVLIAIALSRVPGLPLSAADAVLLGLGMSLCNLPSTVIVAAWLLLLLARRRGAERLASIRPLAFQLLQIGLALLSIVAVVALAASVPFGLLGAPDMHIAGNDSTAFDLRWFQDQTTAELPIAWVVSLPLWIYRVAMLGWSLWLAFALVRWTRWAWESYAAGGAWRSRPGRRPPAPEPTNAAAATSTVPGA